MSIETWGIGEVGRPHRRADAKPARDAGGAATEARIRECLDAVLQQTQGAGPTVSHVILPIRVMDDVARVLEVALAQRAARPGEAVAEEVERLTRERDEAFRRHSITEREACDAATRTGELTRELAEAVRQREVFRNCYATEVRGHVERRRELATAADRLAASERALTEARADAEGWHGAVEAMLTIAGLSPGLGAAEAVVAMRARLDTLAAETGRQPTKTKASPSANSEISDLTLDAQPRATEPGPAPSADTGGGHGG